MLESLSFQQHKNELLFLSINITNPPGPTQKYDFDPPRYKIKIGYVNVNESYTTKYIATISQQNDCNDV